MIVLQAMATAPSGSTLMWVLFIALTLISMVVSKNVERKFKKYAGIRTEGGLTGCEVAERMLRKHPDHITFLGPLTTFFLTVLVGTGHVVYTIMPIICDIALKKNIRPERPCGVSSIASQVGITCSPIAAAVVAFVTISNANGFMVSIPQVLMVTIPSCLCGLMCAAAASYKRGKDLDKDPDFLKRKEDPETYKYMYGNSATTLDKVITKEAKASVFIFLSALLVIVGFAFCQMIHVQDGRTLAEAINLPKMNIIIQIIMLTAAAANIMFCKAQPKKAVGGAVWQSGMVAVVAIYGIAWLADTYFGNYLDEMKVMLADLVTNCPWSIAFVFFLVSVLINSQGAVVVAMLPLAYELGIAGPVLLGVLPSVYGYFFIPNYPSDIATVNFDRSGTTKIGKYLLNHSFMMPGLICVIVSTVIGYLVTNVAFHSYFMSFVH